MKNLTKFDGMRVYFVGIGGISMSGLARLVKNSGAEVTGSDINQSNEEIEKLKTLGVRVNHNHDPNNITKDIDLVVYNYAIHSDNPELKRAHELGIQCMSRAELLGIMAGKYKNVIAISGTHGKTTTTAIIGEIFCRAGLNPTVHIGGESINLNDNTIIGAKDFLILEACEYHNSFRYLSPNVCVVLNIDADHLDYYKDLDEIYGAFEAFALNGDLLICDSDLRLMHPNFVAIGADIEAKNIVYNNLGYDFDVVSNGEFWGSVRLNIIGKHNITNTLFAIAVAMAYGLEKNVIIDAIRGFRGVKRRQEKIGELGGVPVVIDYAHHPTEIEASLRGFGERFSSPLVIFQPHTFSRTKALFDDFVKVLGGIDNLLIYKTYPAREKEILGGRAEDLCGALCNAKYADDINTLIEWIEGEVKSGGTDGIVVLGAGDLAEKLKLYF